MRRAAALVAAAVALGSANAHGGETDALLLRSVSASAPGEDPRPPGPVDGRDIQRLARELDAILADAVQDLGLKLDVSGRGDDIAPAENALIEAAAESWVVSPRIDLADGKIVVRIVAVAPGSNVVLTRTEEPSEEALEVTALKMMRDLVLAGHRQPQPATSASEPERRFVKRARSQGRAVLALNAAAMGGYIGFSIQRASNSDDPRLLYPLMALGTGIGLGSSIIVAEEWDVGLGDAWFLSAAAWWPTTAGLLLADGYDVEPSGDRHVLGLAGAAAGLSLGTFALTFGGMSEGGAALTHTGGAFGLLFGGLTELAINGSASLTPTRGFGFGAGIGVLGAGVVATQVRVSASRILLVDLGATLGALTGAAATSPLVIDDEEDPTKVRLWLAGTATGTLLGAGISYFVTEPTRATAGSGGPFALPYGGIIAEIATPGAKRVPVWGGGVRGTL